MGLNVLLFPLYSSLVDYELAKTHPASVVLIFFLYFMNILIIFCFSYTITKTLLINILFQFKK